MSGHCEVQDCDREITASVTLKSNVEKVKWKVCGRHLAGVALVLIGREDLVKCLVK